VKDGTMKILGLCGSLRSASFSRSVLDAILEMLPDEAERQVADIGALPHFNADLEIHHGVDAFKAEIAAADGIVIVTPEYNYSVPGVLKNALDWASRPGYNSVLKDKPVLVVSVSAGLFGGVRAQAHLKNVLGAVLADVFVWPELAVTLAGNKIQDGRLTDSATREIILPALSGFMRHVGGANPA
jgi:chromate reductase